MTPPADPPRVLPFNAPGRAVVTLDADFRYTSATDEAALVLGLTREALLGQCCWTLFPQCEHTPMGALMRDVMASRIPGELRSPAHGREGKDIVGRVVPTMDGGIRLLFRFTTRVPLAAPTALLPLTGTR